MKKFLQILSLVYLGIASVNGQNTVGLISYDVMQAYDGYNLIYPHNQPNVYLLNNCGEVVHVWEDEPNFRPGNTAYITEEGLLYKAKRDASIAGDAIWAGGGGAILEIRDWDNNLIYQFEMNDSLYRLHHDFAVMPNGNIIALAWEYKNTEECIAAGRDTSTLAQGVLWPDWVFELDPSLDSIVWEWHAWDHLVQDFDSTKANFGVVADEPYKIDLNYGRPDGHPDWHHGNSLDYNPGDDLIMLSIPYFDEIWIIDHSTNTEQAASDAGGFGNRGGDLMFRWGNPITYQAGDSSDQKLFFQHDAQWIDDFLDFSHPYYNRIAVFNNRVGPDYSTANVITPSWSMYDHRYEENPATGRFFPEEVDLTLIHPDTFPLYSTGLSGVQFLSNGNVLLNAGRFGYAFEMTPDNEIVWEYVTPLRAGTPVAQGETLSINNNLTFRITRYPADYDAFEDKDLSTTSYIELDPDTTLCAILTSVDQVMVDEAFKIYPNPVNDRLTVEWDGMKYAQLEIYTLQGQLLNSVNASGGRKYLDVRNYENGIYMVAVRTDDGFYTKPVVIQH